MEQWLERIKKSLFPLSVEKADIRKVLQEWFYTGETNDLEYPEEDCELCGHQDIRYQFTIRNKHTEHELLIGSECITRFDIPALDDAGDALSSEETKKVVAKDRQKLITDAKQRRMIKTLVELKKRQEDFDVDSFVGYFRERGAFTPKQLALVIWRLQHHKIPYHPTDFKLTIKRGREKEQLLGLRDFQIAAIMPCLSSAQKKFLADNQSRT